MKTMNKAQVDELLRNGKPEAEEWITFHDPGLSILTMRKMLPDLFHDQDWYDKEPFATLTEEPQERTLLIHYLPGSLNKTMDEQKAMQPKGQLIPPCRRWVMAQVLLKLSGWGTEKMSVRFEEKSFDGSWVIAYWDGDQLYFRSEERR